MAAELRTDVTTGLTGTAAADALARYGPNILPKSPRRSAWQIVLAQWLDPMNIMLTIVAIVSALISQPETALLVAGLVLLNIVLGSRQELKARASVEALDSLQVPSVRVRRDDALAEVAATDLVPGDVVLVEAGTLTMDMMTATRMFAFNQCYKIEGSGYEKQGAILHGAGKATVDFDALGYGLALCGDATVGDDGGVVGDPTEAALVVLAAKMGVDAAGSRREYPRVAEVPFDSSYKFMATIHLAPLDGEDLLIELVKGAPDVILQRCTGAYVDDRVVPIDEIRQQILDANRELAEQGLRVMSFAIRRFRSDQRDEVTGDTMAAVRELTFVALIGIIDPLRPSAKAAVTAALHAGIDVRMITGDHAITARAIAGDLGLASGVITGPELQKLSDAELLQRLPDLHVFGRVSPQDKLRLVTVMQERGAIVAMTGDAVNDAAALKKADVGVAMGSGSEVTKQSANMILLDDNFATLVHAIELGRDIYGKITAQIRYVMAGLFGLLGVMLIASLLDINKGSVLTPVQLLFISFLIGIFPALGISTDTTEPGIMDQPPRDPTVPILNRRTAPRWLLFGLVQSIVSLLPFAWVDMLGVPAAQSMTFGVLAISTIFLAISLRRDVIPGWEGPYLPYWLWMLVPATLTVLAIELPLFQRMLLTTSLTGSQWLAVWAIALIVPVVIEIEKAIRRARVSRA